MIHRSWRYEDPDPSIWEPGERDVPQGPSVRQKIAWTSRKEEEKDLEGRQWESDTARCLREQKTTQKEACKRRSLVLKKGRIYHLNRTETAFSLFTFHFLNIKPSHCRFERWLWIVLQHAGSRGKLQSAQIHSSHKQCAWTVAEFHCDKQVWW